MSIILKGIDMPAEGEFIHVLITSNGNFGIVSNKNIDIGFRKAIQIPKSHGRLIDEREVKKSQFIINDQWGSYPVISLGNLNCVSTILEAEE